MATFDGFSPPDAIVVPVTVKRASSPSTRPQVTLPPESSIVALVTASA